MLIRGNPWEKTHSASSASNITLHSLVDERIRVPLDYPVRAESTIAVSPSTSLEIGTVHPGVDYQRENLNPMNE